MGINNQSLALIGHIIENMLVSNYEANIMSDFIFVPWLDLDYSTRWLNNLICRSGDLQERWGISYSDLLQYCIDLTSKQLYLHIISCSI